MFSFNHSGWVSCFTRFVLIGACLSSTDIKEVIHKEKFEFVLPEESLKLFIFFLKDYLEIGLH